MTDERVCSRDGVLGPSAFMVGVLGNRGAKFAGSIVLGGVCANVADGHSVLLVIGIDDGIDWLNIGRDRAGPMLSFEKPLHEDVKHDSVGLRVFIEYGLMYFGRSFSLDAFGEYPKSCSLNSSG
jgi:hypothetical protein